MYQDLTSLSPESRVWIYAADRTINSAEKDAILNECADFLKKWAAHGQELEAAATLLEDQFLIIVADESFQMASGCSIDSAFRFVQDLGQKYDIDFFDRMTLSFLIENEIKRIKLQDLSNAVAEGIIQTSTIFFNTNITSLKELNSNWRVKAEESWLKRYFKASETV